MRVLPPALVVVALGAGWTAVTGVAGARACRRAELRRAFGAGPRTTSVRRSWASGPPGDRVAASVGAAVRRLAPVPRDADPAVADRRTGWAVAGALTLALVAPAPGAILLVWVIAAPLHATRKRRARRADQVHDQLPDVVDLLALTTAAGLPVPASLVALGGRPGGPVGEALADSAAHVRRGGATAGALALLAAAGEPLRPLVDALAQHDRYGTPLLPALDRVGIEARASRRRRAEAAARRLPVTLLLPLVLTTFPAFVLLTVVPLLAGSLGSLSLTTP